MKKCASCSKDLPEAALHCVFCGAKQAPAPAVQPGLAKTAYGYSANDVRQQVGQQQPPLPPRSSPSQPPPYVQPPPYPQAASGIAPLAAANAATVMIPNGPPAPPQQFHAGSMPAAPSTGGGGMGIHAQNLPTPQPLPHVAQPYLGAHTGSRPSDPWQHSLRLIMFAWGVITLAAFATPLSLDPLTFQWDAILHGEGMTRLPPLIFAAVGLLAIVSAAIPMISVARGILAALLGLAGILVPVLLLGMPEWQFFVVLGGIVTLVPGLLIRSEYTESLFARILVTIGVICALLPYVLPTGGDIPLVGIFKGLLDAPGVAKVAFALQLGLLVLVVLALLAWMPGPATGGAKLFAWLIILYPLVEHVVSLLVAGRLGEVVKASPYGATMAWEPAVAYVVLVGYGLAAVFGKQLE